MSVLVQGARLVLRRCTVRTHCAAPMVQPAREAGHSHWHNIRHIKEANDTIKQKVALDIIRKIKVAAQEGGSTNPKLNSTLAKVLEEGKSKDVSSTTMLDALKRMEKRVSKGVQMFVEGRGIGNCSVIVEAHSQKAKWLRQQIQHVLKQYGGRIGDSGTASPNFTFKGVVYAQASEGVSMDAALDAAIEAGAEDVRLIDDDTVFQFICEPRQVHTVRTALEGRGFKVQEGRQEYLPHTFVRLDADTLRIASQMLDDLDAIEEVTRVFDNIDVIDS